MNNKSLELLSKSYSLGKLGYLFAQLTAIIATITFGIALFTPPISGPLAQEPIQYPFTEILSRFPRDYIWMYPAMLLMLLFIVFIIFVFYEATGIQKVFAHIGLIFAVSSAIILFMDYFIQVSVVQPSLLNGETEGIALLTQFNPHGLFVVIEEIGYILMSASFLLLSPVFSEKTKIDKAIRLTLLGDFILSLFSFIVISIIFGINREYLFEVAVITINFLALIVFAFLVGVRFRKHIPKER